MNTIETHCQDLYQRTNKLWQSLEGQYPTWQCRFSILYGPPVHKPSLLILGSNPGFDPATLYDDEILTWPARNEYITQNWGLATKLRLIFKTAGLAGLLKKSLGTNQLFFKSIRLDRHQSGLGWANNPKPIRIQLERYCKHEVAELIRIIEPETVLVLGLGVFDDFIDTLRDTVNNLKGRRLAAEGVANGIKSIGIIHPTGARVSYADWALVVPWLAKAV